MKKKFLSLAMAGLMIVVCLTGCSGSKSFDSESFIKTAKKYGMTQADTYQDFVHGITSGDPSLSSVFYASENSEDAAALYAANYLVGTGPFPDIQITDLVICCDVKLIDTEGYNSLTELQFITAVDEKSADELFNAFCTSFPEAETASGEKNGCTYTIKYMATEARSVNFGVYQTGNTIIYINCMGDNVKENNCCDFFCKDLGLVSPSTLKK